MINRAVLVGRLTKDPELRYTQSNLAVVSFTVAVNRNFTTQEGKNEADFISCVAWRKTAESVGKYMKKGSLVGVDGRIQTGSYEAQDGSKRYTTEVICDNVRFLDSKSSSAPSSNQNNFQTNDFTGNKGKDDFSSNEQLNDDDDFNPFSNATNIVVNDDDIPF